MNQTEECRKVMLYVDEELCEKIISAADLSCCLWSI